MAAWSSWNDAGRPGAGESGDGPPYLVPKDAFKDGVFPPERKAALSMKLLFTMVALRVRNAAAARDPVSRSALPGGRCVVDRPSKKRPFV